MAFQNPLQIEQQYQALQNDFQKTATARWHLARIAAVLEKWSLDGPEMESYLLELIPIVAELARQVDPVGGSPEPLTALADTLSAVEVPTEVDGNRKAAVKCLRRAAAQLYAYAGAIGPALAVMQGHPPDEGAEMSPDLPEPRSPKARLAAGVSQKLSFHEEIRAIYENWDRSAPDLAVPVVERDPIDDGRQAIGQLLALQVDLYTINAEDDEVTVEGRRTGPDAVGDSPLKPALVAARDWLRSHDDRLAACRVNGRVRLGQGHVYTTGDSAQLALAVQFVAALQKDAERRVRVRPTAPVAMTGGLDADGGVQPVDEEALPTKIEAVFFSPIETLAVPEQQRQSAERARDRLLERYPYGRLDVIGVRRLRDVFDHRRLVERVETGRLRHLAQKVWRRKEAIGSAVLILALALGLAWSLYGPLDKNPVQARFAGGTMFVQNNAGQTIERIEVGTRTVRKKHGDKPIDLVEFEDVTGDDRNEIIWAEWRNQRNEGVSHLHCASVGADTTHWTLPLRFATPFPRSEIKGRQFDPVDLKAGDLDANGRKEVYVALRHRPYFPGYLMKFDARTGAEQARYVHPGHLRHAPFTVANLDQDAAKELLVGGHSNAFGDAALIVLDSRRIQGHAPVRGDYEVAGMEPARHEAYLRFPRTTVGDIAPKLHPFVRDVRVNAQTGLFTVEVQDGEPSEYANRSAFVLVTFTFGVEPVSMGTSSAYDRLAERLVQAGRLDAVPNASDFERYRQRIRYWTGKEWRTEN